jgi:hypothetical protein
MANKYTQFTKIYMFTNKSQSNSVTKKVISAGLTVAMLSGFALTTFGNINSITPKVNAVGAPYNMLVDNFDTENGGSALINPYDYRPFCKWGVSKQGVDLYGIGGVNDIIPGNGLYIDMNNTNPGQLNSKSTFNFKAGDVINLSFKLGGNTATLGTDNFFANHVTTTVSLGNFFSKTYDPAAAQVFQTFTETITVPSDSTGKLVFSSNDGNITTNVSPSIITYGGNILDDIKMTSNNSYNLVTPTGVSTPTGIVGTDNFPTITNVGCNFKENATASFRPAGTTTDITGKIISGNFVPDSGQKIPTNATTAPIQGVLSSTGVDDVLVPTNFTPVPVVQSGCTAKSNASDNLDTPLAPLTNGPGNPAGFDSFNDVGTSFNGWSTQGGAHINVVRVDGNPFNYGPVAAHTGTQYIDIKNLTDFAIKPFTLTNNGKISVSVYFANLQYPSNPSLYTDWTGYIEILDSNYNVIKQGNGVPFTYSVSKESWFKSEIVDFAIPTAGTYYIRIFTGDWGVFDTVNYCVIDNPTLGTPTATTVAPIVGTVGVSSFPTINMIGSNLPDNTVATFTPAGTTTIINGKIIGGNFVPDAGQVVPADATQGPTTGTLKSAGITDVTVPTNFTPVAVNNPGCTIQSDTTDNFDTPVYPTNQYNILSGSTFNGWSIPTGPVFNIINVSGAGVGLYAPLSGKSGSQYVDIGGATTVKKTIAVSKPGKMSFSIWFANWGSDPSNTVPPLYANFSTNAVIRDGNGNIVASGNTVSFNQSLSAQDWYESSIINAVIPSAGNYTIEFFLGDNGVFDSASYCFTENPTLGTPTATSVAPIVGVVGVSAFPTINMTGSNLPDNTVATFTPAGTTTIINGKIIGGNFVPDAGQVVPANATQDPTTGTLKSAGVPDVTVPTNFTPVAPTATADTYTTTGTTPVTLAPLTGDTGTGLTVKSINGVDLTPGTAQSITVTGGVVNVGTTGTIVFIATNNTAANVTFPYVIQDSAGQLANSTQQITVTAPLPTAPTATDDTYTTVGTAPITLTPLTGDAGTGIKVKSINGIVITPGTAQSITIVGQGVVNIDVAGVIKFTALSTFTGDSIFPYIVEDTSGQTATANQKVTVTATIVTSSSSSSSTSAISVPDTDNVAPTIENAAPNSGDANKDGVQDSLQGNVASLVDTGATPKYVVVSADPTSPCQTLSNVSTNNEIANITLDSTYDYPVGFVNFTSPCATSIKIKMYWYGLDTTKTYINRKFNAATNVYSDVTGITSAIEAVDGVPVLTYTYTVADNGPLDTNPAVGTITDPIGPVLAPVQTNNGGTITIGGTTNNQSSTSSKSISSSSNSVSVTSSIVSSTTVKDEPKLKDSAVESKDTKAITTIRTGGESSINLIMAIMLVMSIIFVNSSSEKSKSNR